MRGDTDNAPERLGVVLPDPQPVEVDEREGEGEIVSVAVARGETLVEPVVERVIVLRGVVLGEVETVVVAEARSVALGLPDASGEGEVDGLPLREADAEHVGGSAEPAGHQHEQGMGAVVFTSQKLPSGHRMGTTVPLKGQ